MKRIEVFDSKMTNINGLLYFLHDYKNIRATTSSVLPVFS